MKSVFFKTLFVIALPIIAQNFLQSFVNILDTIMVGQLGSTEIAAVGLGNQIFFLLTMILFGIGSGGSIFIAQYWGKKDIKGIHRTLGITLIFSLVLSILFTIAAVVFPTELIGLYSKDALVVETGAKYLRISAFCYIPMALSFSFSLSLRSTEQVKLPLYTTIASLFINAGLNYIFIFILNFGVQGAALATVIARLVEFIILFTVAYRKKLVVAGAITDLLSYTKSDMALYLKIAFPVIVNEILWSLGITMQNVIMARASTQAIAAFNITGTVGQLTWVFFIGVGNAAAIIIGKKIGEHNEVEARSYANRFGWFMPLTAVGIGLFLIPISKLLPLFFKVEPLILEQARLMLMALMLTYPFKAFNMCMIIGICRSGGDTVYAAIVDATYLWFIGIPLGALAAFVFKLDPWLIYVAFMSEEILKAATNYMRLRSGKWLNNVIERKDKRNSIV